MQELEFSLVQVYTGNGKGKTTAALGQGIRCLGAGLKVILVSFLKNSDSSEFKALDRFSPQIRFIMANQKVRGFYWELSAEEKAETWKDCQAAYASVLELIAERVSDVLILDEIMAVVKYGIIPVNDVLLVMQQCRDKHIELILTGRNAPKSILAGADLVTEMKEIKHPLANGIRARQGIEY
ncbi:MAG: cob(I)yrinic acid a,c-diamide adenosyltransferase [Firmicutes bacterium HGW-Firmicutes-15]|nr:MAG: cob(I)yrinic acid a,c-diamide adenosyltransferase [Firmicutes bacterium HGW-Firmicutes-15]